MSDVKQEILWPNSGLNTDDDKRYLSMGDSPYRLNILVGEDGSNGVITNMQGNRLAVYDLTFSNTYRVVGSYYNQLTRKCYYFVFSQPADWSSSGDYIYDNHLLVFNEDTETIENVFTDEVNYFGIEMNTPVCDCDMLGDKLYFNPRVSEPKMIDVVMAKNYMDYDAYDSLSTYLYGAKKRFFGGLFLAGEDIAVGETPKTDTDKWSRIGDCYQDVTDLNFSSEFYYAFNVINHIPIKRPSCIYGTDTDKNANNVRGKLFRFAYRYKFFNDTHSLYGAYSDITLPSNDEYYNGEVPDDIDAYNFINVIIPLHSAALIKEVDVIFQETGGDWKRAKIINRKDIELLDTNTYTYKFYNTDAAYEAIDTSDTSNFYEAHDSVPRWAVAQELINKNILTYGGCTEGFDNIPKNDIKVSLTPEIEEITIPDSVTTVKRDNLVDTNSDTSTGIDTYAIPSDVWFWEGLWEIYIDLGYWFAGAGIADGDIYEICIDDKTSLYTIQAADIVSVDTLGAALLVFIIANYPTLTFANYIAASSEIVLVGATALSVSRFYLPGGAEVALTKKRGFKTGSWHPFCIFYYDKAMRRCDAQTSKDNIDGTGYTIDGTTAYIPMLNEYSPTLSDTAYKWNVNWEVNHLPPSYAKYWRWGYAGNALASYFVQYIVSSVGPEAPWIKIDIAPLQTIKTTEEAGWNQFPQSIIDPYVWQHGDRVRFITEAATADEIGAVVEGIYDYEIVKYDDTTVEGEYMIYVQNFDYATAGIGTESMIEIYRPLKTDTSQVFYEFGNIMPIITDSLGVKVHGVGSTGAADQDTDTDTAASGVFEAGDVYHILRTPSRAISTTEGYFHESMWYSDFYESDDYDKGRIGVETSFEQRTLNIIRYSNQYLQQTGINGLSTFNGDHYKETNDIYGNIVATMEVGTTLKVYMEKKSASVLIGRQEYMDADGKVTIATSDVVLGAIRYPEDNYGTQWIESITKNNKYVYGFDVYNGTMWRDSVNGLFPISGRYEVAGGGVGDYKMATWFKDKADALALSGIEYVTVITAWDEKYKNLFVTFKDTVNSDNNETIVFHEPSNRWICFTEFCQTPANGYNEMLELDYWVLHGFTNGFGYVFDEETRFATFSIQVSTDSVAFPGLAEMTLEPLAIGMTGSCDAAISYPAGLHPTMDWTDTEDFYVRTDDDYHSWLAADYDDDGTNLSCHKGSTMICNPTTATLTWRALWVRVTDILGNFLSVGSVVNNGDVLVFYPREENLGGRIEGTVTFTNTYGETLNITCVHRAALDPPTCTLQVSSSDTGGLVLQPYASTISCDAGATDISITFTPMHPSYSVGDTYLIHWTAYINGVLKGQSYFTANEEVSNSKTLSMTTAANSGDTVDVYLSSNSVDTEDIGLTIGYLSFAEAMNIDSVSSSISVSVPILTWIATECILLGDWQSTTITVLPSYCWISSKPSWLTVRDSDGDYMYTGTGYQIFNGDVIDLCPTIANTSAGKDDYLVLTGPYGDTYNIRVIQDAPATGPGETTIEADVDLYSGDEDSFEYFYYPSGFGTVGTARVAIQFVAKSPLYDIGETFTMYWASTRNGVSSGYGNFTAINGDRTGDDPEVILEIVSPVLTTIDEIVIRVSSFQIYNV